MDLGPARLIETDWAEEWKRVQRSRKHVDCPDRWNKRAPSFGGALFRSPYADQFIEALALKPGDSVLDMGCGNGAIAIPLAKSGHKVIARDFSERMLDGLAEAAKTAQVEDRIDAARIDVDQLWARAAFIDHLNTADISSNGSITIIAGKADEASAAAANAAGTAACGPDRRHVLRG